MPRFLITVPVERASGEQLWEITADSAAHALAQYLAGVGDAECVSEDLEVERIGEPAVEKIEE